MFEFSKCLIIYLPNSSLPILFPATPTLRPQLAIFSAQLVAVPPALIRYLLLLISPPKFGSSSMKYIKSGFRVPKLNILLKDIVTILCFKNLSYKPNFV